MTAPRKGTRLRTLVDIQTTALVHPSGPATFKFDCLIPRGTILVVYSDPAPITGALACALEDAVLEEKLLREAEYQPPYPRVSFLFASREVGRRLELIGDPDVLPRRHQQGVDPDGMRHTERRRADLPVTGRGMLNRDALTRSSRVI